MRFFKFIIFLIIIWIIGFVIFISKINSESAKLSTEADAIIVLTGAKGRIDAGIELLLDKKAKYLFISGVGKDATLDDLLKNFSKENKEKINMLKTNIFLGHVASSTKENALETSHWVLKNNIKKIILVTSNYHMLRSLLEMKRSMPELKIVPYTVAKNKEFWKDIDSLKLIFLEYNKFLYRFVSKVI